MAPTRGALHGIKIADFGRVLAGPYATMLLADLGADVTKIERPGKGDDTRTWGPPYDGDRATYFESVNRNKRSLTIDLHSEAGRDQARAIALSSDVVVENFIPGTMDRFGLGFEALHAQRPGLIYASVSGFGAAEGRAFPGYDLLVQAVGGLMSVTGPDPQHPTRSGVAVVDVITGLHLAVGILAALHHREATGEGQHVEVALLTSLLSGLVNQASAYVAGGVIPIAIGNAHPSISPYEEFETADRPLIITVGNDGQFRALCQVLGIENVADDERFATNPQRITHRPLLKDILEPVLRTKTADDWWAKLTPAGVPCGPINDMSQAFELAERLGLDPIASIAREDGTVSRQVSNPIRLSATPPTYRSAPPDLGEANESS